MKLSSLLAKLDIVPENGTMEVTSVIDDFDRIEQNCVFVCIAGASADGHEHARAALEKGAAAVIGERELEIDSYYTVDDSRRALSVLCSAFFGDPGNKLRLIGITGTNGKTTTAEYIRYILSNAGHSCGLIGTLGCFYGGKRHSTGYTTPEGMALYGALAEMVKAGCEYCVMEVSSQALAQKRVEPLRFRLGVFTNLGSDHSDYHKTQEAYLKAKGHLAELSDAVLINGDDAYAERFASFYKGKNIRCYSARNGLADYMANNIKYEKDKTDYVFFCQQGIARVSLNAIGEFSVSNSLAAAAACLYMGIPFSAVEKLLGTLPQVEGRAQMLTDGRINVCVDYAHTPEAFSAVLLALKNSADGGIITVFGCGGDRDRSKRPLMGKIASNMSSTVIITSDNPRSESPEAIAEEIKGGIKRKTDIFIQTDREKAIRLALNKARPGDTVLIAGKGHESVQCFSDGEKYFSDTECVKNILGI